MSFVTHLESALDGTVLPAGTLQTTHRNRPLWVRYDLDAVGRSASRDSLLIKDESRLPTGSFKSRGMAMAISMAKRLGVQRVALPSAGNAGGAAAAYAARAGMECYVFMPADTPAVNRD